MNDLGKIIDTESGEVLVEMFGPPNALTAGADSLSGALYALSETIIRGLMPDSAGGGLGGEFGYGADFENEVFMMHHYCWCEKNDGSCLWCIHGDNPQFMPLLNAKYGTSEETYYNKKTGYFDPPHFWHKASNLRIRWYKWIGRDMALNREASGQELAAIMRECFESIPADARERAAKAHDFENTPEFKKQREEGMAQMFTAMQSMMDSQTPCWDCSKAGMFSHKGDGSPRGGSFESGPAGCVAKTLHDDAGRCVNCGSINTPRQDAALAKRQEKNIAAMRSRFADPVPNEARERSAKRQSTRNRSPQEPS